MSGFPLSWGRHAPCLGPRHEGTYAGRRSDKGSQRQASQQGKKGKKQIIGAGGFVGLARHDVAIPIAQLKQADDGKIVLRGATKQAIKAMPRFEYAKAE
jgi:hypothetical protein